MVGLSATKPAPPLAYASEEGGMSPSRTKNKTCQRADELPGANGHHAKNSNQQKFNENFEEKEAEEKERKKRKTMT